MSKQLDLTYPDSPGYKEGGTSKDAASDVAGRAKYLQSRCLRALRGGNFTADELAAIIGEHVLSVRPRISELYKKGLVCKSGEKRPNQSGKKAIVWRLAR